MVVAPADPHTVPDEQFVYVRIWIQARPGFVLYVIVRDGAIRDRTAAGYTRAKMRVLSPSYSGARGRPAAAQEC